VLLFTHLPLRGQCRVWSSKKNAPASRFTSQAIALEAPEAGATLQESICHRQTKNIFPLLTGNCNKGGTAFGDVEHPHDSDNFYTLLR